MTVSLAITIDQPFPALIVAGVKRFETRGNPPAGEMCPPGVRPLPGCRINRGERIAIHASARLPKAGTEVGSWTVERWHENDSLGCAVDSTPGAAYGHRRPLHLPTSAIVCTARVVDALPIVDAHLGWPGDGDTPTGAVLVDDLTDWLEVVTGIGTGDDVSDDISGQLPYGIWTPGGWAWELDDVEPLADPIPCRGRQGVWRLPEDVAEEINR
jgi:hypothetical protein